MSTYVLIHGAWHTGELLEPVAAPIRAQGHEVHTPTLAGNRPGDAKTIGLDAVIKSMVDYFDENKLDDVVLLGHSYGGMVITKLADMMPERIRRLVYWSAFIPLDGECLLDLVPPHYAGLFEQLAAASGDNSVTLPFPIWREAFINDADLELAQSTYDKLNPHPFKTNQDKVSLQNFPENGVGKSFLHCQEDIALPASTPWHPRLSEKLGLFRLVSMPGSHEVCFTNPGLLAEKIIEAGRD